MPHDSCRFRVQWTVQLTTGLCFVFQLYANVLKVDFRQPLIYSEQTSAQSDSIGYCGSDQGLQKAVWLLKSSNKIRTKKKEKRKSSEFHWSAEFTPPCWCADLMGFLGGLMFSSRFFPTSHTCVCSCCSKHLVLSRREGLMGIPSAPSTAPSPRLLPACVQRKTNGISGMCPHPKRLTSVPAKLSARFWWRLFCNQEPAWKGTMNNEQSTVNPEGLWNQWLWNPNLRLIIKTFF